MGGQARDRDTVIRSSTAASTDTTPFVDESAAAGSPAPRIVVFTASGIVYAPFPASGLVVIGRDATNDLVIDDRSVSRRHARIALAEPPHIEDLGSRNGTFVRGVRIEAGAPTRFEPGEALQIGDIVAFVRGLRPASTLALVVAFDGAWFQLGSSPPVHLGRRRVLPRLLLALAQARTTACGRGVTPHELREAGWPGERMTPTSAANRVYIAIARLRALGLGHAIVSYPDGYLIPGEIEVKLQPSDAPVPGR